MMKFNWAPEPWQKNLVTKHGLSCPDGWYGFACGEGWKDLIDQLFTDLKALGWNGEIHQIKEKFGGLRAYVGGIIGEKGHKLIWAAEDESYKTCEDCGSKNELTTEGSWVRTLCLPCRGEKGL